MNNETHQIKWGARTYRGNAAGVADEIRSIGQEVKPEQIVEYAETNPHSELHKCFTWDNDDAARKYRLHEARQIVASLTLTVATTTIERKTFRLLLRNETNGGYKQTMFMLNNQSEYEKLLATAKKELSAFREKYKVLAELGELFDLIDKM